MTVYLVPVGRGRFELYSEPAEEFSTSPDGRSRLRRWAHAANFRWRELVDAARLDESTTPFARWRDRVVCRLAETIAEQRTLWALGRIHGAALVVPSTLDAADARRVLDRLLESACRRHGWWLAIDVPLFILSGILAPIPGPNAVAYYLAFRVVGHFLSWRGARQSLTATAWTLQPDSRLTELESLLAEPRAARASRVDAIAAELNLHRLPAFFERVAA
jgi:hypothetical protein